MISCVIIYHPALLEVMILQGDNAVTKNRELNGSY